MIQYRHRNCSREFTPATFAYELPSASVLKSVLLENHGLIQMFGVTFVDRRDNYCRATGRIKSQKNMKVTSFHLTSAIPKNNRLYMTFVLSYNGHEGILVTYSVDFKNDKVRMEWIDFA